MATYVSKMRTNPFIVKDVDAFRAALQPFDERVEDFEVVLGNEPNQVILLGSEFYTTVDNDDNDIDIVDVLQAHVADDAVVIATCAGWEGMRYTVGSALLVTKTKHFFVDAEVAVKEIAEAKGILTKHEMIHLSAQG